MHQGPGSPTITRLASAWILGPRCRLPIADFGRSMQEIIRRYHKYDGVLHERTSDSRLKEDLPLHGTRGSLEQAEA